MRSSDALEKEDPRELKEELGDLLLRVLFRADLALEAGNFGIFRCRHWDSRQNDTQASCNCIWRC